MKIPEKKTTVRVKESNPKMKRPANVFDGVLISISPTKLIMKGKNGKESSMKLHEEIKSSCDGVACECKALKQGQKIRVFTEKTDLAMAIKIASLDKRTRFAPIA